MACIRFIPYSQYQTHINLAPKKSSPGKGGKNKINTSNKYEAAIKSNQGSEAVKQASEVHLLPRTGGCLAGGLKLYNPTREIHTYPFVPTTNLTISSCHQQKFTEQKQQNKM